MKVLMLWKYYPEYLSYFYKKYPQVLGLPFEEHRNSIFSDHFGWPADLARHMNDKGIKTEFMIANAEALQWRWAEENSFRPISSDGYEKEIAMEQIRRFRPDILWLPSLFGYFGDFVREASAYCKKAITWVSCAAPADLNVSGFTTLITSQPDMLKEKQGYFKEIIITKPGFDPSILGKIGNPQKRYGVTFIGQISSDHIRRAESLAFLLKNGVELNFFGMITPGTWRGPLRALRQVAGGIIKRRSLRAGAEVMKEKAKAAVYRHYAEIVKMAHHGPVFGLDMYRTLAASRIIVNIHIDIAGPYVGNMRMFEATGIGTCLVNERSRNINELFDADKEILTYGSKEEMLEVIKKVVSDPARIERTARAGQEKTLRCHTIERLFKDIEPALMVR